MGATGGSSNIFVAGMGTSSCPPVMSSHTNLKEKGITCQLSITKLNYVDIQFMNIFQLPSYLCSRLRDTSISEINLLRDQMNLRKFTTTLPLIMKFEQQNSNKRKYNRTLHYKILQNLFGYAQRANYQIKWKKEHHSHRSNYGGHHNWQPSEASR